MAVEEDPMDANSGTDIPQATDWPQGLESGAGVSAVAEADVQSLAETFAVTPEAVRLAVARVGTGFREVQRELGGRR